MIEDYKLFAFSTNKIKEIKLKEFCEEGISHTPHKSRHKPNAQTLSYALNPKKRLVGNGSWCWLVE